MKRFNVTGTCVPEKHYMVDIKDKLDIVEEMIREGEYFVINRPRQYGKTNLISQLSKRLSKEYLVIRTSFEGTADYMFKDEEKLGKELLKKFSLALRFSNKEKSEELEKAARDLKSSDDLSEAITNFILNTDKKVILFIDEVDEASDNRLFLSFLGMLRNKFILASDELDYTFHSVILAGVYDIKNLKLKARPNKERKYNSPWNIAANFDIDMSFQPKEIETMLLDYENINNVTMDKKAISEELYYYTNGYPFLVSRLCQIIDENILTTIRKKIPPSSIGGSGYLNMQTTVEGKSTSEVVNNSIEYDALRGKKKDWNVEFVVEAVKIILKESNTLFDDLIKNIEDHKELYDLIQRIILVGEEIVYVQTEPTISLGSTYGIITNLNGRCVVNNKIFEHYIYDHMAVKKIIENETLTKYNYRNNFLTTIRKKIPQSFIGDGDYLNMQTTAKVKSPSEVVKNNIEDDALTEDNGLDFKEILLKYQQFMKEQYTQKNGKFIEREGKILFLAFLKPIINGIGFEFKEVQISAEKRLDVVVTYGNHKYVSELKIWYGEEYHKKGLKQFVDYLHNQNLDKGYLVIYNFNKEKEYKNESITIEQKEIFIVWV